MQYPLIENSGQNYFQSPLRGQKTPKMREGCEKYTVKANETQIGNRCEVRFRSLGDLGLIPETASSLQ